MGAEVAVCRGVGTIVFDVRRGDGPKPRFNYLMSALAAAHRLIEGSPEAAAAIRGHRQDSGGTQSRCRSWG